MKKRVLGLVAIVLFWVGLLWYLDACGVSSAVRSFAVGVYGLSVLIVLHQLFCRSVEKKKDRKCRACDKRGIMAINYGEDEGLCKSCFYGY